MRSRLRPWRKPALVAEPLVPPSVVALLLRSKLAENGVAQWRATGRSMRGCIESGDVVVVRPIEASDVRPGLVVLAYLPFGLVVHRVHSVNDGVVRLKGDARRRADPAVPLDAVVGVVDVSTPMRRRSLLYRLMP